jgi:hypothetical protein
MRGGRVLRSLGLAVFAALILAPAALADDSQIKVSEVYSDGDATTSGKGDFIELQLAADGQQVQLGHSIVLFNATGATVTFPFPVGSTNLPDSQRTVLLGWNTNPVADYQVAASLNPQLAGGAVCLSGSSGPPVVPIDCVSWGSFPASSSLSLGAGTPAHALNPLQSLTRKIKPNCPTFLEPADDTNNSAGDFSLATPSPRNNLSNPTEVPCTTPAAAVPVVHRKCKKRKRRSAETAKKRHCRKRKR